MAHFVDLVVYGRILFDVCVGSGNICLGLVVIVIAGEILDGVIGEKFFKLTAKLCGKCFVVCKHEGGTVDLFDNIGHGKGFSRAGNSQKHLLLISLFKTVYQLFDRLRLVSRGLIIRYKPEFIHKSPPHIQSIRCLTRQCL